MINYRENNCLNHYREFKVLYREYVGEELLSRIITYDKMKTLIYTKIDLSSRNDYITPKKNQTIRRV